MWILIVYVLIVVVGEAAWLQSVWPWIELSRWLVCRFRCRYSSPCSHLDGLWQCVGPSLSTQKT